MFNFSSLAQMIDQETKARDGTAHVEDAGISGDKSDHSSGPASNSSRQENNPINAVEPPDQRSTRLKADTNDLVPRVRVAAPSEYGSGLSKYDGPGSRDHENMEIGVARTIS